MCSRDAIDIFNASSIKVLEQSWTFDSNSTFFPFLTYFRGYPIICVSFLFYVTEEKGMWITYSCYSRMKNKYRKNLRNSPCNCVCTSAISLIRNFVRDILYDFMRTQSYWGQLYLKFEKHYRLTRTVVDLLESRECLLEMSWAGDLTERRRNVYYVFFIFMIIDPVICII